MSPRSARCEKLALTSMSGWGSGAIPPAARNPARSHGFAGMARGVHQLASVPSYALVALLGAAACVVPPDLELDEVEGANHPPVLRRVRDSAGTELRRPGDIELVVNEGELVVTAEDLDLDDTLYVRMYFDYGFDEATPVRVQCEAAPGATATLSREITCPLPGLCNDALTMNGGMHILEIDVLDRVPTSTAARPFRDVTAPGEIATGMWNVKCVLPPT